ncbi:Crp/Fnr family transcriptional regulator [Pseudodesulfovibrio sp.]|uniref:Crp/Fnr family transcriptional regulator n=1 Tax=unclassified Pseudodesulfovibrio TaxID=2661612 RepID=UPI003AFF8E2D
MQSVPFDPDNAAMVEAILSIPAFAPLGKGRLADVMRTTTIRDYAEKELVITQGETDSCMFFLMSGHLAVEVDGVQISVLEAPGTIFGEMGVIETAPRSASVTAMEPSRCLAMDIAFFDRLEGRAKLAVQAFFYKMFYEVLVQRLRETNERIADLDMQRFVLENMEID